MVLPVPPRPRTYRVPRLPAEEVRALYRRLTEAHYAAATAKTPQEFAIADAERHFVNRKLLEINR